jgi:hypothetical protein
VFGVVIELLVYIPLQLLYVLYNCHIDVDCGQDHDCSLILVCLGRLARKYVGDRFLMRLIIENRLLD